MKRLVVNAALAAMLVAIVAAAALLRPATGRPNLDFLPQMAHSPRYNAFSADPNFRDGATLQPPPPHTIARGFMPLHYGATPQDALRAGQELHNPFGETLRARQRGQRVFAAYCVPCHGPTGTGDGLVAQRGYPPPPSLLAPHAVTMKDGQLFHVLSFGQNNMPSYAAQISREDRWNVIVFLRSRQRAVGATPPAVPDAPGAAGIPVVGGAL